MAALSPLSPYLGVFSLPCARHTVVYAHPTSSYIRRHRQDSTYLPMVLWHALETPRTLLCLWVARAVFPLDALDLNERSHSIEHPDIMEGIIVLHASSCNLCIFQTGFCATSFRSPACWSRIPSRTRSAPARFIALEGCFKLCLGLRQSRAHGLLTISFAIT